MAPNVSCHIKTPQTVDNKIASTDLQSWLIPIFFTFKLNKRERSRFMERTALQTHSHDLCSVLKLLSTCIGQEYLTGVPCDLHKHEALLPSTNWKSTLSSMSHKVSRISRVVEVFVFAAALCSLSKASTGYILGTLCINSTHQCYGGQKSMYIHWKVSSHE